MIVPASFRADRPKFSVALFLSATAFWIAPVRADVETMTPTADAQFGTWGVDLSARDLTVRPGDDFQRYAVGKWLDANPIKPDQSTNGVGYEAQLRNQDRLRSIVTDAPSDSKIGALYTSYMDEARLERLDAAPLTADLARVEEIQDKAAFTRDMARSLREFGASLFGGFPAPDPVNPGMKKLFLSSGGLGLPDRDYYLLDTYTKQRDAYRAYVTRSLQMIGRPNAEAEANQILAFETQLAKRAWPQVDQRNMDKTNNPMTLDELKAYAPGVDWDDFFAAAGLHTSKLILSDKSAVKAIAALYDATPLDTLKAWQRFRIINDAAPFLSKRFVDSKFEFGKTLSGVSEQRPRWRRGIDQVDNRLGDLIGQTYVERYFPPASKALMERLVADLKVSAADRINQNSWMESATKKAALTKLAKMDVMVGYPDKFRDYSKLEVKLDDLYGNVKRSASFEYDYWMSDLDKPVQRKKWGMTPATVNAYNGGLENKIVFPAGILQPPYFDPAADAAVNYGAIGAIIGHEIMHGFDDQGRKVDENGAVRDWWTPADAKRFEERTTELGKQYSSFEAAPGVFINGTLTMGENIGDMSGLEVAYAAYKKSLGAKPAPIRDGLTGDQRFFLAFAQTWRGAQRPEQIKNQVASDVHSPRRFRTIGPLRNLDAWYKAFNIKPGSKFYLPPEKRVHLW